LVAPPDFVAPPELVVPPRAPPELIAPPGLVAPPGLEAPPGVAPPGPVTPPALVAPPEPVFPPELILPPNTVVPPAAMPPVSGMPPETEVPPETGTPPVAILPAVARLPAAGAVVLEAPPPDVVPPVVAPGVEFKEHPHSEVARVATSAGKRTHAMRGLRPEFSFVMKSSCLHLVRTQLCRLVCPTAQRSCPTVAANAHIQLWPEGISAATVGEAILNSASFLSRSPLEQAPFYS
jgi:hypothetical protein